MHRLKNLNYDKIDLKNNIRVYMKLTKKLLSFLTATLMLANTSKIIGEKTYKFNSSGVCTNP